MADTVSATGLAERIARLEAIEAVREVIARYCRVIDELRDLVALAELLAPEVVLRNPDAHIGREAVLAYYESFFNSGVGLSRHHPVNTTITLETPDRAAVSSYFFVMIGREGRSHVGWGNYADVLEHSAEGWRYVEKVNDVLGLAPLDEGWGAASAPARLWGAAADR